MSDFVKNWADFDIDSLARNFRRHRKFIRSLKFILPVIAIVLTAILLIYPTLYPQDNKIIIQAVEVTAAAENPPMVNPRFAGFDKDNQPYNISAQRAYPEKDENVRLEDISADITLKNGTWISIITPHGFYESTKKYLTLNDIFEIFITEENTKTYHIEGSGMDVDMDKNLLSSKNPVDVEAPMGRLTAGGFRILNREGKITFTGPVKLVIRK